MKAIVNLHAIPEELNLQELLGVKGGLAEPDKGIECPANASAISCSGASAVACTGSSALSCTGTSAVSNGTANLA